MPPSRFRALLATLRIANMPSVVCNVWLGIMLGLFHTRLEPFSTHFNAIAAIAIAGLLLYASGNLLNDWKDRAWDQTSRPERALPRGLFHPSTYLAAAVIGLALAISLAAAASTASGITAAVIAVNIAIYTHWHKGHAWTVIPMGLCRALLPVMGFLAFDESLPPFFPEFLNALDFIPIQYQEYYWRVLPAAALVLPHALAIFFYIVGLSLSARSESRQTSSPGEAWIGRTLLVCAPLAMSLYWMRFEPSAAWFALIPCAVWIGFCLIRFRKPVSKHVSALLAGIPLLDWVALLAFAIIAVGNRAHDPNWLIATCFLLPPLAFLTGRLLQRIAPAT